MKNVQNSTNRKPMEGIESLLFVLGGALTYALISLQFSTWAIILVVIAFAVVMERVVNFLKKKNAQI